MLLGANGQLGKELERQLPSLGSVAAFPRVSFGITSAKYSILVKRSLNSQLDTHKLRSQLSFDLPHWKDGFLAVASDINKGVETV